MAKAENNLTLHTNTSPTASAREPRKIRGFVLPAFRNAFDFRPRECVDMFMVNSSLTEISAHIQLTKHIWMEQRAEWTLIKS